MERTGPGTLAMPRKVYYGRVEVMENMGKSLNEAICLENLQLNIGSLKGLSSLRTSQKALCPMKFSGEIGSGDHSDPISSIFSLFATELTNRQSIDY